MQKTGFRLKTVFPYHNYTKFNFSNPVGVKILVQSLSQIKLYFFLCDYTTYKEIE